MSVTIQDVNDEVPKWIFPNTDHFTVNVSYTEDTGSLVVMVQAKDRDAGVHAEVRRIFENMKIFIFFIVNISFLSRDLGRNLKSTCRGSDEFVLVD